VNDEQLKDLFSKPNYRALKYLSYFYRLSEEIYLLRVYEYGLSLRNLYRTVEALTKLFYYEF